MGGRFRDGLLAAAEMAETMSDDVIKAMWAGAECADPRALAGAKLRTLAAELRSRAQNETA